jgi:hypothetical protein
MSAFLAAATACVSGSSPRSGADSTAVALAVHARFDSLAAPIRRFDVERMLEFYASDSSIVRAIDGQLLPGRALVVRNFREGSLPFARSTVSPFPSDT